MVAGFEIIVCCGTVAGFEIATEGGSFGFTKGDCIVASFVLAAKSDTNLDSVVTGTVTSFEFDMGGCVVAIVCLVFAVERGMVMIGFDGTVVCLEGGGTVGDFELIGNCIALGFGFSATGVEPMDGANGTA